MKKEIQITGDTNIEKIQNYVKSLEEQIQIRDELIELYKQKSEFSQTKIITYPVPMFVRNPFWF